MKKIIAGVAVVAVLLIGAQFIVPWLFTVDTGEVYSVDGIAIGGTDPVAYFTQGEPTPGSAEFSYEHNGATWHFASAAHRDLFAATPEQYTPVYGGYCAFGMSYNSKYPTVPEAWDIVDGKLYLNYDKDIQQDWQQDKPGLIQQANEHWQKHHPQSNTAG